MRPQFLVEVGFSKVTHFPGKFPGHFRILFFAGQLISARLHFATIEDQIVEIKLNFTDHVVSCNAVRVPKLD